MAKARLWNLRAGNGIDSSAVQSRSDINLKLDMIKKSYRIVILAIALLFFNNPFAVVIDFAISTFISVIVNGILNKKLLNYGYFEQLPDIAPHLFISGVMGVIVYLIGMADLPAIALLLLSVMTGLAAYIALSRPFKVESYAYVINTVRSLRYKKNSIPNGGELRDSQVERFCVYW